MGLHSSRSSGVPLSAPETVQQIWRTLVQQVPRAETLASGSTHVCYNKSSKSQDLSSAHGAALKPIYSPRLHRLKKPLPILTSASSGATKAPLTRSNSADPWNSITMIHCFEKNTYKFFWVFWFWFFWFCFCFFRRHLFHTHAGEQGSLSPQEAEELLHPGHLW